MIACGGDDNVELVNHVRECEVGRVQVGVEVEVGIGTDMIIPQRGNR